MRATGIKKRQQIASIMASNQVSPFSIRGGGVGSHYEEVDQDFKAQDIDDEADDNETVQRRRRQFMNTNIGDLYGVNNSRHNNNSSLSFNLILLCLLGFLMVFGLGYYVLGKHEQRTVLANEVEEQKELERLKVKYGLVERDNKKPAGGEKNGEVMKHQVNENEPDSDPTREMDLKVEMHNSKWQCQCSRID
ncbi:hypothetical protein ACHAWT_002392 [Skeletonema menzelii]